MASQLDKSLDEIAAERRQNVPSRTRRGTQRHEIRRSVGGVQKRRSDSSRGNSNETWTHDLFDRSGDRKDRLANNSLALRLGDIKQRLGRLKVENLHYELSEEDLSELFNGVGPVEKLRLIYDKMGRSEGIAYVTYTSMDDAKEAIRRFNGANAAGQPITVTLDTEHPAHGPGSRNDRPGFSGRGRPRVRMTSGRFGLKSRGTRRDHPPRRTQEDLDRELEDFMNRPPPAENGNGSGNVTGEEMAID